MDELLFISAAKTKADLPKIKARRAPQGPPLTKFDTAAALDYAALAERPAFRGAVAAVSAVLINVALLSSIERATLDVRTPAGEVIVAELDATDLPLHARASREAQLRVF